jgi:hypothetical protein
LGSPRTGRPASLSRDTSARVDGSDSCEDLARDLWIVLEDGYQLTPAQVDVSEDGESGATVTEVS